MHLAVACLVALLAAGCPTTTAVNSEPGRVGCYQDDETRVWKQWANSHEQLTPHSCRNMCQGFQYAGLQYASQCMCGDELPPIRLPDASCDMACVGDPAQTCGGVWALEVFPVELKAAMRGEPMGCFHDTPDRFWKTGQIFLQNLTPQRCWDACRGFGFAGMEDGNECFCGDALPSTRLAESSCRSQCNSLAGKTCGGPWALEVFALSEAQAPLPRGRHAVGYIPSDYQTRGALGPHKLYADRNTWNEAWQHCEDDDAHLLIVDTQASSHAQPQFVCEKKFGNTS